MIEIEKLRQGRKVSISEYNQAKQDFDELYANASDDDKAKIDGLMRSSQNYSSANPMNNRSTREYQTQVYKNAAAILRGENIPSMAPTASTPNWFNGYSSQENQNNANYVTSRYLSHAGKSAATSTQPTGSYHRYNWANGLSSGWTLDSDTLDQRMQSFADTLSNNLNSALSAKNSGKKLIGVDENNIELALGMLQGKQWTRDNFKDLMKAAQLAGVDPGAFRDYFGDLFPGVSPEEKAKQALINQGLSEYDLSDQSEWARNLAKNKGYKFFKDKEGNIRIYDKNYINQIKNILEYNQNFNDRNIEGKGFGHALISDADGNVYLGDSRLISNDSPFAELWNSKLTEDRDARNNKYWDIDYQQGKHDSESPYLQALEKQFGSFKGTDVSSLFQGDDKIFVTGNTPGQSYYDKDDYFGGIIFNNNSKFYKVGDDGTVQEVSWDALKDKYNWNGWQGEGNEQLGTRIDLDQFLNEAGESSIDINSDMGGRTFWTALLESYGLDTIAPAAIGAAIGATAANGSAIGSYAGLSEWAMRNAAKNLGKDASEKAIKKEAIRLAGKALNNAVKKGTLKGVVKKAAISGGVRASIHGALASTGIGALIGAGLGLSEAGIRYGSYDNISEDIPGFVHNLLGAVANSSGQLHTKLHGIHNNAQLLQNLDYNNKKSEYTKFLFQLFNQNPDLWNQLSQQEKNTFIAMKRDFNRNYTSLRRVGGKIIRAAKGTVLNGAGEPLGEFAWQNPDRAKANIDIAKLRETYRKSNETGYGDDIYRKQASEAQMFEGNGKMSTADALRISTMAQDVASIVASFVPGAGTGVAAGLGVTALGTDLVADVLDPAVSAGEVAKNAAINAGFAGLGLIPGAKMHKVVKNVVKYAPKIITAAAAMGITMDESTQKTFAKLGDGTQKLNREDWRNLSHVLSLVAAGTRGVKGDIARYKVKKGIVNGDQVTIKGLIASDGKSPVSFSKEKIAEVNKALGEIKPKEEGAQSKALAVLKEKLNLTDEQAAQVLNSPGFLKTKTGLGKFSIEEESLLDKGKTYDNLRAIWNEEARNVENSSKISRWFANKLGGGDYTAKQRAILEGLENNNLIEYTGKYNPMIDWQNLRKTAGATRMKARYTVPEVKDNGPIVPTNNQLALPEYKPEPAPIERRNPAVEKPYNIKTQQQKITLSKESRKAAMEFAKAFGIEIKSEKDYLRFIQDLKIKNPELYRQFLSRHPIVNPAKVIAQAKAEYNFKDGGKVNYQKLRK